MPPRKRSQSSRRTWQVGRTIGGFEILSVTSTRRRRVVGLRCRHGHTTKLPPRYLQDGAPKCFHDVRQELQARRIPGLSQTWFVRLAWDAMTRGIKFNIAPTAVLECLARQHSRCADTGQRLWAPTRSRRDGFLSIDRIDGSKGYEPGNIRVVTPLVQQTRLAMPLPAYHALMFAVSQPELIERLIEVEAPVARISDYPVPDVVLTAAGFGNEPDAAIHRAWWARAMREPGFASCTVSAGLAQVPHAELRRLSCGAEQLEAVTRRLLHRKFYDLNRNALRRSASRLHSVPVEVSAIDLYLLYLQSGARCQVTGVPIHLGEHGGVGATASFDRMGEAYAMASIRVVHSDWNLARGTRSDAKMRGLADQVASHQLEQSAGAVDSMVERLDLAAGVRLLATVPLANKPRPSLT